MSFTFILLSGGVGSRMHQPVPKQYLLLAGKPMIMHTLEKVNILEQINKIIIVCSDDYVSQIKILIEQYGITKSVEFATAGKTRQESVYSGLNKADSENVIIHEAARPFVTIEDYQRLISDSSENVTFGIDIPFTVLKGHEYIEGILNRSELINIQLPQKFNKKMLLNGHVKAIDDITTLIISILKPIVGIFFVINSKDKVTSRILGLALVELIGYTSLFIVQMNRGKLFFSLQYWKYALRFNLPLIPHYLSATVLNSADRIMIKNYTGASDAGIYSLAYSISQIMILFNTALNQTLGPWIYQKIKEKRTKDITGIAYLSLGIIAFVNLVLIAVAPEAVAVFAPPAYHDAIWVIPPVAMSVIFIFSYDLFAKFEFYYEKSTWIMFASVIGAALNVGMNYVFIRQYGYYAAAYTTLICYIIYAAAHYFFMRKICDTYLDGVQVYDPKVLLLIYGTFILAGFALMLTYNYPVIRYGIIAAVILTVILKRKLMLEKLKMILALRKKN